MCYEMLQSFSGLKWLVQHVGDCGVCMVEKKAKTYRDSNP